MARKKVFADHWMFAEAARCLKVSRPRVSQMVAEGKLATVRINGRSYISGFSLFTWMEKHGLLQLELFEKGGGGL